VKYKTARYALFLSVFILIPWLIGCESVIEPQDKWPVITDWELEYAYDVTLKLDKKTYFPKELILPDDYNTYLTMNVRTYHTGQAFTYKLILERVIGDITELDLVNGAFYTSVEGLLITETARIDHVLGTYVAGSGHPPQGVTELSVFWEPGWFPTSLPYWYETTPNGIILHNRYVWNYTGVLEDADGRSDTFSFNLIANLKVDFE